MSSMAFDDYSKDQWHAAATRYGSRVETRHFINGELRDSIDGERFESVNPATGETLTAMAAGNHKDIDRSGDGTHRDSIGPYGSPSAVHAAYQ